MKRIGRWAFAGVAAMSFIMALVTAGLWVQSFFGQIGYVSQTATRDRTFQNVRGGFQYAQEISDAAPIWHNQFSEPGWYRGPAYAPVVTDLKMGFGGASLNQVGWHLRVIVIPAWPIVIAFLVLPGVWIHGLVSRIKMRRRRRDGRCQNCGYDLRASSGCCPECGGVISTSM